MANFAQNLYIFWVSTLRDVRGVRVFVVSLQAVGASALFTVAAFSDHLAYSFAGRVGAFAASAFPVRMCRAFWHSRQSSTCARAIFASTPTSFTYLKKFSACFARTIYKRFWLTWPDFLRALFRTRVCGSSDMGVRTRKLITASCAKQYTMTSSSNNSLEFCHG